VLRSPYFVSPVFEAFLHRNVAEIAVCKGNRKNCLKQSAVFQRKPDFHEGLSRKRADCNAPDFQDLKGYLVVIGQTGSEVEELFAKIRFMLLFSKKRSSAVRSSALTGCISCEAESSSSPGLITCKGEVLSPAGLISCEESSRATSSSEGSIPRGGMEHVWIRPLSGEISKGAVFLSASITDLA